MGNQVDRRELRGAAFGRGVWQSAGRNRAVRIVGGLILAFGSLGLLWPFAPMHQREVLAAGGGTLSDTMHVVLGAVTVLLAFAAMTFLEAPRLQTNLPTPWIGLWERINISAFLLWVAVLATALLRAPKSSAMPDRHRGGVE